MTATFYVGDALEVMAKLPEKSVDLVLSSPPFLALRSYLPADHPSKHLEGGSQATPGEYIDWLVDVAEACARVLAPHGSLCFELGDTYAGSATTKGGWKEGEEGFKQNYRDRIHDGVSKVGIYNKDGYTPPGGEGWPLPKSLSLIPELFRLTLVYGFNPLTGRTTERWRLRNVIRWVRPNPPVGALGDKFRPATSELMVFCKSAKRYFDLDAVRTPFAEATRQREQSDAPASIGGRQEDGGHRNYEPPMRIQQRMTHAGAPPLDWWNIPPGGYEGAHYAVFPPELCVRPIKAMCPEKVCRTCGEPRRRILNDRTGTNRQPALAAHIRERREAVGVTSAEINNWFGYKEIAKNWERTDEFGARIPNVQEWPVLKERLGLSDDFDDMIYGGPSVTDEYRENLRHGEGSMYAAKDAEPNARHGARPMTTKTAEYVTLGFSDCGHDNYRPGMVLDPFVGSGTVLAVATGHGRDAIGIDLDARNWDLALERVGPMFLQRGEVSA